MVALRLSVSDFLSFPKGLPVKPVSAKFALVVSLYVIVVLGSLHLLAASYPSNTLSKAYLGLNL